MTTGYLTYVLLALCAQPATASSTTTSDYFGIRVIDSQTGRGVPMVRLRTVNGTTYESDSAGWVAYHEPGLMNREVYFSVSSHGYRFPADGMGNRGVRLRTTPGTSATIKIDRNNIAERVYRITGQGIYRDSLLLGQPQPLQKPVLNGDVLGQDTVQAAEYRGRIYWFWGDTNRASYPLGQFKTAGATSLLPAQGGLPASSGIDLNYFVDESGFSRRMAPFEGEGAIWLHGLFVLRAKGRRQMIAHYSRVKTIEDVLEHGLAIFNDSTDTFEKLLQFDDSAALFPRGQSLSYEQGIEDYIYFCTPFPSVRVPADLEAIRDSRRYESFTCLKPGTRYELNMPPIRRDASGKLVVDPDDVLAGREKSQPAIDRDADGRVVWGWKSNTGAMDASKQHQLVKYGHIDGDDARLSLTDDRGRRIFLHAGSVHWNAYRRRWILLGEQIGGETSLLGEMWYAEADGLEGPWQHARHVVSHDKYTLYNPAHHPFLDERQGRVIYFEGTFADTFSAAALPIPRYNYNQIMYRLDLGGERLGLPARR